MSDQSGSSRFQGHFESALEDYEQKTKIKLTEHPLAEELEKCHSSVDITVFLQGQAPTFGGSNKIIKSIERTVKVLYKLSEVADAIGLVRQKALMGVFHVSDTSSPALCETDIY
jgi:hypothetical protein